MTSGSLIRAILYKETTKMRLAWLLLFLFNAAFLIWLFIGVRHLFRLDHPEVVWYRVITLGQEHYGTIRVVPLLVGVIVACLQFLPEMRDERLRLSLHLPASSNAVILSHLLAGLIAIGLLYLCETAVLTAITLLYFPADVVPTMLQTVAPWMLAGVTGYLGTTLALLEPGLRLRIFILALTAGLVSPMLTRRMPGDFAHALPVFALAVPLLLAASLLPAYHFRHRRVDL